jgi:hypothetical protein
MIATKKHQKILLSLLFFAVPLLAVAVGGILVGIAVLLTGPSEVGKGVSPSVKEIFNELRRLVGMNSFGL